MGYTLSRRNHDRKVLTKYKKRRLTTIISHINNNKQKNEIIKHQLCWKKDNTLFYQPIRRKLIKYNDYFNIDNWSRVKCLYWWKIKFQDVTNEDNYTHQISSEVIVCACYDSDMNPDNNEGAVDVTPIYSTN